MNKERNLDMEVDEIFAKYSDFLTEKWAEEMEELLDGSDSDDSDSGAAGRDECSKLDISLHIAEPKPKANPKSAAKPFIRYAAVAALVFAFVVAVPLTDASAWRIWNLDFFSSSEEDHKQVESENANDFAKYYIEELPEGYYFHQEETTDSVVEKSIFLNDEGKKIQFSQHNKESFISKIDNENGATREERIGEFRVLVYESEVDISCEITTDDNVMVIYSTDTYEICKVFIENLIEK